MKVLAIWRQNCDSLKLTGHVNQPEHLEQIFSVQIKAGEVNFSWTSLEELVSLQLFVDFLDQNVIKRLINLTLMRKITVKYSFHLLVLRTWFGTGSLFSSLTSESVGLSRAGRALAVGAFVDAILLLLALLRLLAVRTLSSPMSTC